ncbi:MAG: hypothetical protein PQJ60_11765 [Spirochaetales bacterium]|nr:hypothetical protein [Spirochaetales bacterium]
MKKAIIIISLLGLIIPFLTAQDAVDTWKGTDKESEYYSVNLMIYRISPHPDGYRVEYYQPNGDLFAVYLPLNWFEQGNTGPGQIVWGEGPQYPYMSLYYKDGKIDHMRLYVIDNEYHTSWGTMDRSKDYSEQFGIAFEDLKLEY